MNNSKKSETTNLLSIDEVCQRLRICRSSLHKIRRNPHSGFPEPLAFTPKSRVWPESVINDWIEQRQQKPKFTRESDLDSSLSKLEIR